MFRNVLSKIFSSKAFYIVFSVLVAITMWVFVEINENQETTITLEDVPVIIIGEEILRDRDLFILPTWGPQTITLEIDCTRSMANRLSNSPIEARIDVSRITTTGGTSVVHEIIIPDDIDQSAISRTVPNVGRISLQINRLTTRQIRVEVPYTGGAASDFLVDETIFDPHSITVHGPADVLSMIYSARVEILRENLAATYIDELPFVLIGEDGEDFGDELYEQLTFSHETIHVTVPVRMTKQVWLDAEFIYGAGTTSSNVNFTIDPAYIILAGEPDILREINSISIGPINLWQIEVFSNTAELPILIPNGVENQTGISQARVYYEISGLEIEVFPVSNIQLVNIPDPDVYDVRVVTLSIDVRVRGSRSELNRLKLYIEEGLLSIRIVADVSETGTGQTRLPASRSEVIIDGFDRELIGAVGQYRVTVDITEDS